MIFLIPARAGSKRLPGKNKRLFCGLPLWMWCYACAIRLRHKSDSVIVSTDDDELLMSGHKDIWLRPPFLCQDDSKTKDLVDTFLPIDDVALLQPTSPTRPDSLVRMMIARGDSCRSVTNGKPNGQCYVYRRGVTEMADVETEQGHDIDTLEQLEAAEQDMLRRFA